MENTHGPGLYLLGFILFEDTLPRAEFLQSIFTLSFLLVN